jgi:hypothetical protein
MINITKQILSKSKYKFFMVIALYRHLEFQKKTKIKNKQHISTYNLKQQYL